MSLRDPWQRSTKCVGCQRAPQRRIGGPIEPELFSSSRRSPLVGFDRFRSPVLSPSCRSAWRRHDHSQHDSRPKPKLSDLARPIRRVAEPPDRDLSSQGTTPVWPHERLRYVRRAGSRSNDDVGDPKRTKRSPKKGRNDGQARREGGDRNGRSTRPRKGLCQAARRIGAKLVVADLNRHSYEEFEAEARDMTADSTVAGNRGVRRHRLGDRGRCP